MTMGSKRGCCSSSLLLFLLTCGLGLSGAFLVPVRLMTRTGTGLPTTAPRTAGTDASSNEFAPEPVDRSEKKGRDVREIVRDAVFDATDSIADAAAKMPDFMASTNKTLLKLGDLVNEVDDRYFSKYLGFQTTLTYKDTLAAAASTVDDVVEQKAEAAGSAGKLKPDNDGGDGGDESKTGTKTEPPREVASSVVEEASETASAADEVAEVITEMQRKAVEDYKSSPRSTEGGAPDGAVTPTTEAALAKEADLESLLKESRFSPKKLKRGRKAQLVETIASMEASYPEDASPVDDPSLSGQWTLVYSSSSRVLGRALKGVLAGFFKTSNRRQIIDAKACTVLNACRARLRMTPWGITIAKKGHYRPTSNRKVAVVMPKTKRGLLRRLLPAIRAGKSPAEVTYLSRQWRICRVGGATLAFRKTDGGS